VRPFRKIIPKPLFEDVMSFLMAGTEPEQKKLPARIGSFMDGSKIITKKHLAVITNWIKRDDAQVEENQFLFTLIYRGTRDGFDVNSFHEKVNGKGEAIAVIKIENSNTIVGGFNATGWHYKANEEPKYTGFSTGFNSNIRNNQHWINSKDHFVFSFKTTKDRKIGRSSGSNGIYVNNKDILNFGDGDLLINGKCETCSQHSYDNRILDRNSFIVEKDINSFIVDKDINSFIVEELEVFSV
ncbi:1507_t:CDS:1, partial [Acaulospora morrowiae]